MSGSDRGAEFLKIDRYIGPSDPPERWEIRGRAGAWRAMGPGGPLPQSFPGPVAALIESGACAYERGGALDVRTSEQFDPFRLLPALASWADAPGRPHDAASDWSRHPRIYWVERHLEEEASLLEIDSGRLIRINDLICGVYLRRSESRLVMARQLVLFAPADPLWPVFYDGWVSASTDNGWGIADYEIGEVTPGFQGEMRHVDGADMELRISELAADHPKGLYDAMVSWVTGLASVTFGLEEIEMTEADDSVRIELPEGSVGKVDTGPFGPTVLRSKGLT